MMIVITITMTMADIDDDDDDDRWWWLKQTNYDRASSIDDWCEFIASMCLVVYNKSTLIIGRNFG